MSGSNGTASGGIDLSAIPEPMRSLLVKQLDKMPASMREKLLREGSPILDRLIAKAREHAGAGVSASRPPPEPDFGDEGKAAPRTLARSQIPLTARDRVPTVMPGDSHHPFGWLLAFAIAVVAAGWYALQG